MRQTSTETISPATAPPNFAPFKRDSARFSAGQPGRPACGANAFAQPIPFLDRPAQHEPGSEDHARTTVGETAQHPRSAPTTSPNSTRSKTMSKLAALNLAPAAPTRAYGAPSRIAAQLQARLKLPPGEAFDSLFAVHDILDDELPNRKLDVYEAGGIVLIAAPNPNSLSGVVTKYTPHWFHVWFYRHVRGDMDAGKPGEAPFPTFFHPLVSLSKLDAFAKTHGLEVIYCREYESPRFPEMRARKPMLAALVDAAAAVVNCLLLRKTDVRHGDYHVILRKR